MRASRLYNSFGLNVEMAFIHKMSKGHIWFWANEEQLQFEPIPNVVNHYTLTISATECLRFLTSHYATSQQTHHLGSDPQVMAG